MLPQRRPPVDHRERWLMVAVVAVVVVLAASSSSSSLASSGAAAASSSSSTTATINERNVLRELFRATSGGSSGTNTWTVTDGWVATSSAGSSGSTSSVNSGSGTTTVIVPTTTTNTTTANNDGSDDDICTWYGVVCRGQESVLAAHDRLSQASAAGAGVFQVGGASTRRRQQRQRRVRQSKPQRRRRLAQVTDNDDGGGETNDDDGSYSENNNDDDFGTYDGSYEYDGSGYDDNGYNGDDNVNDDATSTMSAAPSAAPSPYVVIGLLLHDNNLTGRIPDNVWTQLPSLLYVEVSNNPLLDVNLPTTTTTTTGAATSKLRVLRMASTAAPSTDVAAGLVAVSQNLRYLDLSNNAWLTTTTTSTAIFPTTLLQLTQLRALYAVNCQFTGSLPAELGTTLTRLRELDLSDNALTGALPSSWSALTKLQSFAVADNKLTGPIPDYVTTAWSELQQLSLNNNYLNGTIPVLDQQPYLHTVRVRNNGLTGNFSPDFLGAVPDAPNFLLTSQLVVDVSHNFLSGTVPATLDWLENVPLQLDVSDNRYTAVDPDLCDNEFWNNFVVATHGCAGLACPAGTYSTSGYATSPDLTTNDDDDVGAGNVCQSCAGVEATLPYVGATTCHRRDDGQILRELFTATGGSATWRRTDHWTTTAVVNATADDYCQFYGVSCWADRSDGNNGRVRALRLSNNGMVGSIPASIFALDRLEILDVSYNEVTLDFSNIATANWLEGLQITGTQQSTLEGIENAGDYLAVFTADQLPNLAGSNIPDEIYRLTSLRSLSMSGCGLTGPLSTAIRELTSLEELFLYDNNLRGNLPGSAMGALTNLRVLSLARNQFSGMIPSDMSNLPNLIALSLQDQRSKNGGPGLTGELLSFADTTSLTSLMLGGNSFTGTIPVDLLASIDVSASVTVDVTGSRLSGTIPGSLSTILNLNLYLEGNAITEIHPDLCYMGNWMSGLVSDFACDAILCPPGTYGGRRRYQDDQLCSLCRQTSGSSTESDAVFGRVVCDSDS